MAETSSPLRGILEKIRDDTVRRAEGLGMPLDDVIANVITALKSDAERLGIAGSPIS